MGMDLYGITPIPIKGKEVEAKAMEIAFKKLESSIGPIEDGHKTSFQEVVDILEQMNPGKYFRANIWAWRPIHMFCETVIEEHKLSIDTEGWDTNSGCGLDTAEKCIELADAFEPILAGLEDAIEILPDTIAPKEKKELRFYTNMMVISGDFSKPYGVCYEDGKFISAKEWTPEVGKSYKKYLRDRVISHSLSLTSFKLKGKTVTSSYSVEYDHLKEFVHFLRHCGGFNIY